MAEAAGETAKVGQVTGVMADALNWSSDAAQMFAQYMGGDVTTAEDAFNVALSECTSEQERQTLVTDTLTALYGDAADTYRDTAGSVIEANKATADLTLSQASLGEKVEPVTTSIKDGFSGILDKILELTGSPDLQGFADNIDSAFSSFTDETLPSIMDGINDFKDNLPAVGVAIGGVTAAMIAFKVAALSAKLAEEGLTIATKLQAVAQGLLNAVMNANPIGLVILAITALITIFMVLWNKCEWFRNFWIGLWDKIKSAASAVADWLPQAFSRAVDGIKNVFSGIGDFFGGLWDKIKERFSTVGTKIGEAIGGAFKKAINSVIATVEKGINFIPNSINKMLGAINKLPGVNISPIQTVSLPRLAKGGVVNRATTALIGEDGAEAVIPLERNRQWIKEVAKEFAAQGNQNKNVVVNQTNNYSQAHSRYEIWKSEKATVNAVKLALKEV